MPLTVDEVVGIFKNENQLETTDKNLIQKAIKHEERVKFHSEMSMDKDGISTAYKGFLSMVEKILPRDKFEMFKVLFQFPVATVPLMDEVYIALSKLFDSRNSVVTYDFLNKDYEEDWRGYREKGLSEKYWEEEGFEMMKNGINSLVVVDLPQEQEGDKPEPYIYFLSLSDVVAMKDKNGTEVEWVVFNMKDGNVGVFDDTSYRVFKVKDGHIERDPIVENYHDLGFCPVRFFWTSGLNKGLNLIKKSPISSFLGKLDMLLFYEIANEHLNLFARFPIYSAFEEDCDYEMKETGYYCNKGFLSSRDGSYVMDVGGPKECPVCSMKKLDGAGTFIKIEPPSKLNGNVDLRNPVQITSIPKESLDYNNEDIKARRVEIYKAITGFNGMSINDKAVNEKQVVAIFESLEAALKLPQLNFERIMEWVESTSCLLRYGKDIFKGMSVSLGTQHYVMSSSDLLELYLDHKEKGAPFGVLDVWEDRYYESEYKNDPLKMKRFGVLKNLDPLRHIDIKEAMEMSDKGKIKKVDYLVKVNLSSFVLRFERENGLSIVEFGKNIDFGKKIETIKKTFVGYAEEMMMEEIVEDII